MAKTDVLFVNANAADLVYGPLANDYSAFEQPIWSGLIANHVRTRGFNPEILDCEVMGYTDDDALHHIKTMSPRLIAFGLYGQQPSASAQNMEGAVRLANRIKKEIPESKILFFGIYPSALPEKTLKDNPSIDFVCTGEGPYTISDLLHPDAFNNHINGLAWRHPEKGIIINSPSPQVKQEDLEKDLPGVAWDLMPMSRYRTALWHSLSNGANRQPFAALYTSLNCPYGCTFCCIAQPFGGSGFKFWSPEFIVKELTKLSEMGIVNIKIADEMWLLRPDHFLRTCELIIEMGLRLNIWAYARIDTIKNHPLDILKKAGVNWLALGIESGNKNVRKDVVKGRFEDIDVKSVVNKIRNSGINVIGNFIFGLPTDTLETMQETLDMAMEMNTEEANFYSCMAYPGSKLHKDLIDISCLPEKYVGYSQHSYLTKPLPTKYLTAAQVLKFRDEAWMKYHTNPKFLEMIRTKFGEKAYQDTVASTKIVLRRKLLEDVKR